jgi:8-amino-7-oxononanoate synthase
MAIRKQGLERSLLPLEMLSATRGRIASQLVDVFSSNDYLGLAAHPDMLAAWRGGGSGSSRLIAGTRPAHAALEEALEERFGRPALVFSSGYQANLAVLSTLLDATATVGSDALNHASIIDGLRLSSCAVKILEHGVADLSVDAHVVEGLYSMNGDVLDLSLYATRPLFLDEAHAVGCMGPDGRGVGAQQGVEADVLVGTFGKAYGAAGAFVICSTEAKGLLTSMGRSFVYTTALAEAATRAALVGLRLADEARRAVLKRKTSLFRQGLSQLGLPTSGQAHVVPVILGDRSMEAAAALMEAGIYVPGIRYPTVAKGQERLRFSLSAAHSDEQINRALDALDRCCC